MIDTESAGPLIPRDQDGVDQVRSAGKDLNRGARKIVALAQDHVQDAMEAGQIDFARGGRDARRSTAMRGVAN